MLSRAGISLSKIPPLASMIRCVGVLISFSLSAVAAKAFDESASGATRNASGANAAAIETLKQEAGQEIEMRQIKYLNNIVEQDHRAIKRVVRPMLGFKSFLSARTTLQGIELMHMIKKGQMIAGDGKKLSAAGQFYSLAA